jgi:hypothetical protein
LKAIEETLLIRVNERFHCGLEFANGCLGISIGREVAGT